MKRFLMEHKDSMKPPYISTLDGILTAGGELIGYQELEMDSPYLDVHEDTSYTKDYVTLHSHEFYELLFCRSGNLQYLIGNTRYQIRKNDIILVPPGTSHRPLFLEQLREPIREPYSGSTTIFLRPVSRTSLRMQAPPNMHHKSSSPMSSARKEHS